MKRQRRLATVLEQGVCKTRCRSGVESHRLHDCPLLSLVNSAPTHTEHHRVTDGRSELMVEVFGPAVGAHARSASGVAQLPLGACVEIELIAELE